MLDGKDIARLANSMFKMPTLDEIKQTCAVVVVGSTGYSKDDIRFEECYNELLTDTLYELAVMRGAN